MKRVDEQFIKLRQAGHGYKRIARTLNISIDDVKRTCSELDAARLSGQCKQCHTSITSIKGKKRKQFCSDRCRWDYWNSFNKS
ncbi:hypothetical protein [Acholeplasma laidlawii]|uniref:hypothetical protein n=1 Tax=Acholeplasma laidlawii TaxID=2148 RepID=UPI0021F7F85C|nr:hypothetical protein [Acholeplasma laidlawii]